MLVAELPNNDAYAIVGGTVAKAFTIDLNEATFKILSDTIYSNKVRAVVREILCNAVDAHIEAGRPETFVEVTLNDHEFSIRDFGNGIPEDQLTDIYCTYMKSTKAKDPTQTGGFGLGSKAPIAYTDHFTVTNRNAGRQSVYVVHRGTEDTKGAPGIRLMTAGPTEESGLTVSVPIKSKHDMSEFREWVERITNEGGMRVKLNGRELTRRPLDNLKPGDFGLSHEGWGGRKIRLLYGNVEYPIEMDHFHKEWEEFEALFGNNAILTLRALPSTITVAPSREALSFDERTIKSVRALIQNALTQVRTTYKRTIIETWHRNFERHSKEVGPNHHWSNKRSATIFDRNLDTLGLDSVSFDHRFAIGVEQVCMMMMKNHHLRGDSLSSTWTYLRSTVLKAVKGVPPGAREFSHTQIAQRRLLVIMRRLVRDINVPFTIYYRDISGNMPVAERTKCSSYGFPAPELVISHSREAGVNYHGCDGVYLVSRFLTEEQINQIANKAGRFGIYTRIVPKPVPVPRVKKPKPEPKPEITATWREFSANYTHATCNDYGFSYYRIGHDEIADPAAYVRYFCYQNCGVKLKDITLPAQVAKLYPKTVVVRNKTELDKAEARHIRELDEVFLDEIESHFKNKHLPKYMGVFRLGISSEHQALARVARLSRRAAHIVLGIPYRSDAQLDRLFEMARVADKLKEHTDKRSYVNTPWAEIDLDERLRRYRSIPIDMKVWETIPQHNEKNGALEMFDRNKLENVRCDSADKFADLLTMLLKTADKWKDSTCKAV